MMMQVAQVCGVIVGVAAVLKLAYDALKLHLAQEFATKADFHRLEHKIDYIMGNRILRRRDAAKENEVTNG